MHVDTLLKSFLLIILHPHRLQLTELELPSPIALTMHVTPIGKLSSSSFIFIGSNLMGVEKEMAKNTVSKWRSASTTPLLGYNSVKRTSSSETTWGLFWDGHHPLELWSDGEDDT
ncbi:hypothetical protein AVEN_205529-1 [Araneus ventricosus]|uniref:Uncharacterized protein n=1 Tax=Araneus ventricosus TaxID=182803 RepID=A0A4Y2USW9_ARAVE|nr:hypothetical protein AVEN_205529-1 [Araneus ventricosus]